MLHEQVMFVAPRGSGTQHKTCAAPGSASSSLASFSSRNEVSLSPLHLSLWAELLSWWLLALILGLPQLGPATELFKGCHLFPFWRRWLGRAGKRGFL